MKTITARELRKMRDADEEFLLVNTLDADHFEKTKIPGAVSIPQNASDFAAQVEKRRTCRRRGGRWGRRLTRVAAHYQQGTQGQRKPGPGG